jgi:hypothetical protein
MDLAIFWVEYGVLLDRFCGSEQRLGQETLHTGDRILTDIADKIPDTHTRDIVSRHMSESTQKLVKKLRGGGRKRKKASCAGPAKKQNKPARPV